MRVKSCSGSPVYRTYPPCGQETLLVKIVNLFRIICSNKKQIKPLKTGSSI